MKTVQIKCDACDSDLFDSGPQPKHRLVLVPQPVGSSSNFRYSVLSYPSIKRSHHFCDLACLDHWRDRERHRDMLWRQWHEKWIEEHGERHGRLSSYMAAPEEVRSRAAEEFAAAALAAFPMEKPKRK